MNNWFLDKLKETACVSLALFGLGFIGIGLQKMYEPFAYIFGGLVLIYFANLGIKQKNI